MVITAGCYIKLLLLLSKFRTEDQKVYVQGRVAYYVGSTYGENIVSEYGFCCSGFKD